MRAIRILVVLLIACFALAAGAIVVAGLNDEVAQADVVIVPGNTVAADGTPSPRLKARLDVALNLYREGRARLVFVSGGTGKEGFDEAVAMANYLSKNGIPVEAIVKDSLGVDTGATARNAAAFMRAKGLRTAMVATQYFHVPRMKLALQRQDVEVAGTQHARYFEMRDLYSIPREVIAYASYSARS